MEAATAAKTAKPEIAISKGELVPVTQFREELRDSNIVTMLPPHIDAVKFEQTVINAIRNKPELLQADRQSLLLACTKAAEDGLQPDGREGVMNVYRENKRFQDDRGQWRDRWLDSVSWIPMVYGIRKRALEICGIVIDAQAVHEKDAFKYGYGDQPFINHEPPLPLGTPRGALVGAYAVFKQTDGTILHREVLDADAIAAIKKTVKAQKGLLWTAFEPEAWRKSALRRGIKTLPSVVPKFAEVERIAARNDDDHTFDRAPLPTDHLSDAQYVTSARGATPLMPPPMPEDATVSPGIEPEQAFDAQAFLAEIERKLEACKTIAALEAAWAALEPTVDSKLPLNLRHEAYDLYGKHDKRIIETATTE